MKRFDLDERELFGLSCFVVLLAIWIAGIIAAMGILLYQFPIIGPGIFLIWLITYGIMRLLNRWM